MQAIDIEDQGETWTTLTIRSPISSDFTAVLKDFFASVDTNTLMGDALSRTPENAAQGVLEALMAQAKEWEKDDE